MSINIKKEDQSYDAIVVGTGISGGWAVTVLGYFNSEVGATMAANYDKTPGKYEGCIPINKYGVKVWAT